MRPMPRTQAPTTFQRRWPRDRRIREAKNAPELKKHEFRYNPDLVDNVEGTFRRDCNAVFPRGTVHVQRFVRGDFDRSVCFVVTQTKAQRLQRS